MTASHPALAPALFQQPGQFVEGGPRGMVQGMHGDRIEQCQVVALLAVIVLDGLADPGCAAEGLGQFGAGMEAGDLRAQAVHQVQGQAPAQRHALEQRVLGKAPHHHHPVEHLARAIEAQVAIGGTVDRTHFQVEVWCGAPVEAQFGLAGPFTAVQAEKVEGGVGDGALELVGALAV
ncbi:hypothetical protein D3C84_722000 [compost metagenome]